MFAERKWYDGLKVLAAAGVLVVGLAACDGALLDVEDPDNVQPSEELVPSDVEPRLAGVVNEFRTMYDFYVLYTGLLTDEFILAGTFPTRREIDQRNPISNNVSINADVWSPVSVTRAVADQMVNEFNSALGTDEFDSETASLQRGIAFGNLYGGYTRLFMAEFFCQSILGGQGDLPQFVEEEPESAPLGSVERARQALDFFETAEARAAEFGISEVELAALVGQARTHMFLHSLGSTSEDHLTAANDAASAVWNASDDFVSAVEYSVFSPGEENGVFQFTWGVNASLRWTVGDGTDGSRGNEQFAYYGTPFVPATDSTPAEPATGWLGQGLLIEPGPADTAGLGAFNGVSPVNAQTLYAGRSGGQRAVSIPLATAWEARMIMAEVALRNGSPGAAESMVDDLLQESDQARNPMTSVNSALTSPPGAGDLTSEQLGAFEGVTYGDESLEADLAEHARAYEAGLWLTSHRQHYLRRMAEEFNDRFFPRNTVTGATSLWPDHGFGEPNSDAGDAITLPVPSDEVDTNQNISNACPAGYP
jgi:hypothetical protein